VRQISPEAVFDGLRNLLSALSLNTGLLQTERDEKAVVWSSEDVEARVTYRRRPPAHAAR
jgi:hypothetical protein